MEQKSHVSVRTASSQKIHTEWARALQKILQKLDGTTRFLNEYSNTRRRIKLQSKESEIKEFRERQTKGAQLIQEITKQMSREEKVNASVREESKTRVLTLRRKIAELEVNLSRAEHDTELAIQDKKNVMKEFERKELEYKESMRHQVTKFAHRIAILTRTIEDLKKDYDKMARLKMGGDKEKLASVCVRAEHFNTSNIS